LEASRISSVCRALQLESAEMFVGIKQGRVGELSEKDLPRRIGVFKVRARPSYRTGAGGNNVLLLDNINFYSVIFEEPQKTLINEKFAHNAIFWKNVGITECPLNFFSKSIGGRPWPSTNYITALDNGDVFSGGLGRNSGISSREPQEDSRDGKNNRE
jgi:hypothetical protein